MNSHVTVYVRNKTQFRWRSRRWINASFIDV